MIDRSALVPVEICSAPLELTEDLVWPLRDSEGRTAGGQRRGLDASGKIDRVQHVGDRRALQVDRGVAVTVGLDRRR